MNGTKFPVRGNAEVDKMDNLEVMQRPWYMTVDGVPLMNFVRAFDCEMNWVTYYLVEITPLGYPTGILIPKTVLGEIKLYHLDDPDGPYHKK